MLSKKPAVYFPAVRAGSGADVFTERLAEGLRERGLRAEITWLPHHAEFAPWIVSRPCPPKWANIVHINTWLHTRFLPKDLPIIATMHHCVHDHMLRPSISYAQAVYHRFWIKGIERTVLNRADKVIAVSHYSAARTKKTFDVSEIRVIHNGVDLESYFHDASNRQSHTPFRLLYVGNWSPRKGSDLLAPIMKELGPDFELRYTSPLCDVTQSGGLPDNMIAVDHYLSNAELAELYRQSDALLLPSRLEGFGLVALEAQACALPVIATRGSALPEVIEDRVTGLLCPQDDIKAFVEAARYLADDCKQWKDMCRNARIRTESHFDIESMVDKYIDVYSDTLFSLRRRNR